MFVPISLRPQVFEAWADSCLKTQNHMAHRKGFTHSSSAQMARMAQSSKRSTTEYSAFPSTQMGSFFQIASSRCTKPGRTRLRNSPIPPEIRFPKTPSLRPLSQPTFGFVFQHRPRGENSPQTTPKSMNISHRSALIFIGGKNSPCFRPFFSQFFPFTASAKTAPACSSRPLSWVRFFSSIHGLPVGFVFPKPPHPATSGFEAQNAHRHPRFAKYAFSSPLSPVAPQKTASTSPPRPPQTTLPPPPPDGSATPNPPVETYFEPPQTVSPAPQKPAAAPAHSQSPPRTSHTAPTSHTTSPPAACNSATAPPPAAAPKFPHAPSGHRWPPVGSSPHPQCCPLAPVRPQPVSHPASGHAKLEQVPAA